MFAKTSSGTHLAQEKAKVLKSARLHSIFVPPYLSDLTFYSPSPSSCDTAAWQLLLLMLAPGVPISWSVLPCHSMEPLLHFLYSNVTFLVRSSLFIYLMWQLTLNSSDLSCMLGSFSSFRAGILYTHNQSGQSYTCTSFVGML